MHEWNMGGIHETIHREIPPDFRLGGLAHGNHRTAIGRNRQRRWWRRRFLAPVVANVDPHPPVLFLGWKGLHAGRGERWMCDIADGRYFYTLAGSDEAPPVKRAPQGIPFLPCRRERHALVGTAVFQRMHATLTIPKQQQWLIAEHRCEGPAGPDRSAFPAMYQKPSSMQFCGFSRRACRGFL